MYCRNCGTKMEDDEKSTIVNTDSLSVGDALLGCFVMAIILLGAWKFIELLGYWFGDITKYTTLWGLP